MTRTWNAIKFSLWMPQNFSKRLWIQNLGFPGKCNSFFMVFQYLCRNILHVNLNWINWRCSCSNWIYITLRKERDKQEYHSFNSQYIKIQPFSQSFAKFPELKFSNTEKSPKNNAQQLVTWKTVMSSFD